MTRSLYLHSLFPWDNAGLDLKDSSPAKPYRLTSTAEEFGQILKFPLNLALYLGGNYLIRNLLYLYW